jgi:hypothetical protein
MKRLKCKKTADFTALSHAAETRREPAVIVDMLENHFTERHTLPNVDSSNQTVKEALQCWQVFRQAEEDDIDMVLCQSDLRFDVREVGQTISALKVKNSSGLDKVSNKMVKLLPVRYHGALTQAYNRLFRSAYWGKNWKTARTICLNKPNNPIPTTTQLRPISMLPVFSKIYERLFLLRFNQWSRKMNILPAQQSGARAHQGTLSRVSCLLEQITQSQTYNTFTPVIYVDFLQAFDRLWHQGLLLKLKKLDCPAPFLIWLVKYFTNRSLVLDYGGVQSNPIRIERGAPQGSCLGPVVYITSHHDLPDVFSNPNDVHAYVDDIAIVYTPSIHLP